MAALWTAARAACATFFICASSSAQISLVDRGLLPGDAGVGPATNSQAGLSISQGGNQFLAVWTDSRARSSGSQTIQSDTDIFGIRLDGAGNPIDPAPFQIAGGMGYQQRPQVAWNGESWLVLFESQEPTLPPVTYYETRLRTVRVSGQGQVLDPTPFTFPPDEFDPATIGLTISGIGGQWLIARCIYHSDGYGTYLAGQRMNANGQLIDSTPIMLNDWVYGQLKITAQNGEYLVMGPEWNNASILKARRIAADLQPLAPSFSLPSGVQGVASNGSELYLTWIANFTDLVGSRMTNTGTLLNPAGTLLFSNFSGDLDMAHDGGQWWISRTINTAALMRVDASGNRLDPIGGVPLPIVVTGSVTSLYDSLLAPRAGGGVLFAWTDLRQAIGNDQNAFTMPVSSANVPGTERCFGTSFRNQRNSDQAIGPGGSRAVAYVSELANDDRVMVQFVDSNGNPIAQPIEVAQAPTIGVCGIAWNGSVYMITWDQGGAGLTTTGIVARRMNPDGSFIGSTFAVMPGMAPSIEALGEDFCIAGTRFATYPQFIDLWVNRIDGPTGTPLDGTNGILLAGGYFSGLTHTRTDGTQWLVASHSQWTHDSSQGDAVLVRIPPTGTPASAFNPTPYFGATGDLDVAFSGSNYLLAWRNNSLANANNYVVGRIMNLDGTYGPAFTIAEATGRQLRPTVAWDGTDYIVAWDDQRNQLDFFDYRTDVYATRISATGSVLDNPAFPIVNSPDAACSPSIVAANGVTTVATSRFVVAPPLDSYRIGLSTIGEAPCPADLDNGSGTGTHDQAVDISDLIYFLTLFEAGSPAVDLDNDGADPAQPDGGVDISDLLFFLLHFEGGC